MAKRGIVKDDTDNTTLVFTKPAGTVDGDFLLAWAVTDEGTSGTVTWPSGFVETSVTPLRTAVRDAQTLFIATKIASGEGASWSVTCSNSFHGGVFVLSGRDTTTPIHRISGLADTSGWTSPWTAPSSAFASNTTLDGCDIIYIMADDESTGGQVVHTAPAGFTLEAEHIIAASDFKNAGVSAKYNAAAGETGVYSGTGTRAGASADLALFAIAIAPGGVTVTGHGGEEPYDSEAFYSEDREYPYVPHIGGRYRNANFRYGAQPDSMMQEFGDRISILNVPSGSAQLTCVLAGGFTPGGALTKQSNRNLAGGFTPGGALQKLTNKALAGGFTPSGVVTKARQYFSILAGGFTPSGALVKQTKRTLAGGSTPTGALTKQTQRNLAGSSTPTGALTKQTQRSLAGGFTPNGTLTWARQYFRTLTGGFTPSGVVTKTTVYLRTLAGGFTPSGALTKLTNRILAGGFTPGGVLTKLTNRLLTGGFTPAGAISKKTNRTLSGGFTPSGTVAKITVFLRTLTGGFTPSGTVTKQTNRTVSGGFTPSGAVGKRTFRNLAGSVVPSGILIKLVNRVLAGGFTPSGALTKLKAYFKTVSGGFTPGGTVQRQTAKATQGAINPSGAVSRRTFRTLSGQIGLSGQITKYIQKNFSGMLFPQGQLTVLRILHDFLILLAGTSGARYILGALSAVRYRLESRSQSRYGPTHTGEASDEIDNKSSSKDDL